MLIVGGALNGGPEFGAPTTPEDPTLSTPGFPIRRRLNDLWAWTEQGGFQRLQADSAQGIPRRNGAAMVWDTFNHRLLVYGGNVKAQDGQHPAFTNEVWEWTQTGGWRLVMPAGSTSRPVEFDGPPPDAPALRWGSSVVSDPRDNRLLVFGGQGENPVDARRGWYHYVGTGNDLWAWRPPSVLGGQKFGKAETRGTWTLLSDRFAQGSPPPRAGAAAVWDSTNQRLLIFGGSNLGRVAIRNPLPGSNPGVTPTHFYNDLWSWSQQSGWQLLSPDGAPDAPSGRFGVATWDATNNRLVVSWTAELIHSSTLHSTLNLGGAPRDVWEWTRQRGWRRLINPNTQTIWVPTQRSILQLFFDHARPGALLASMGQVTRTVWALVSERVPSVPAPKRSSLSRRHSCSNRSSRNRRWFLGGSQRRFLSLGQACHLCRQSHSREPALKGKSRKGVAHSYFCPR